MKQLHHWAAPMLVGFFMAVGALTMTVVAIYFLDRIDQTCVKEQPVSK